MIGLEKLTRRFLNQVDKVIKLPRKKVRTLPASRYLINALPLSLSLIKIGCGRISFVDRNSFLETKDAVDPLSTKMAALASRRLQST